MLYITPRRTDVSLLQHLREQSLLISARAIPGPSIRSLGQPTPDAAVPPDLSQLPFQLLPPPSAAPKDTHSNLLANCPFRPSP
jgi:hypothetical protein